MFLRPFLPMYEPRRLGLAILATVLPADRPQSPYSKGYQAFHAKWHLHDNPFPRGSFNALQWEEGWGAARDYPN